MRRNSNISTLVDGVDNCRRALDSKEVNSEGMQWSQKGDQPCYRMTWVRGIAPKARSRHGACLIGLNYIVFGGTDGLNYLADVNLLDTANMTWVQPKVRGKRPTARAGHCCVGTPEAMFIFGGTNGEHFLSDMFRLDGERMEWRRLESGGVPPTGRAHASMCMSGNKLIVFGGYDGLQRMNDLHILDLSTFKWHQPRNACVNAPHPRCGHTASVVHNQMIVFGGERDTSWPLTEVHCLDLRSHEWTEARTRGQIPPARCFHSMTAIDDKLYVFGGTDGKSRRFNDLAILDTSLWQWSRPTLGGSAPLARSHHTTTFLGTSIFVFGGSAGYGKGSLSDFVRLEFDGLSSWSGPNIERLAIEHTVMKEQFGALADDADAQREEAVKLEQSLHQDVERAKQALESEQNSSSALQQELDEAIAENVNLKRDLDQTMAAAAQTARELEDSNAELQLVKLRVGCVDEQMNEIHSSLKEATHRAMSSEAQLQAAEEQNQRLVQENAQLRERLEGASKDAQLAMSKVAQLEVSLEHQVSETQRFQHDAESAIERQVLAEQARAKADTNLEQTMTQLSEATVASAGVYERCRHEFEEATTRYREELAAHHSARASLEASLEASQQSISQLQARVAEVTAVSSVVGTQLEHEKARAEACEAEQKRTEASLMDSRQAIGQLEGAKIQLQSLWDAEKSRLQVIQEEMSALKGDLRSSSEETSQANRRADRVQAELDSERARRADCEREAAEKADDFTKQLMGKKEDHEAELRRMNEQLARSQEMIQLKAEEVRVTKDACAQFESELGATRAAVQLAVADKEALDKKYQAQVSAFEELQQAKSELREQLQQLLDEQEAAAVPEPEPTPVTKAPPKSISRAPVAEPVYVDQSWGHEDVEGEDGVMEFLQANQCMEFYHIFRQHEIDADTIPYLTETDLIAMGVHSVGPRRKLLTLCHTAGGSPSIASKIRHRGHR